MSAYSSAKLVPGAPPKIERIATIERMMIDGVFERGATVGELSSQWGLARLTVERDADEASRNLRRQMPDEDYRAEIIQRMDKIAEVAFGEGKYATSLNALRAMLEARGLLKHRDPDPVEPMSAAELVDCVFTDPELKPLVIQRTKQLMGDVQDGEWEETE